MSKPTQDPSTPPEELQPSLLDLLTERLAAPDAKPVPLPLASGDIGGELIAILSKGLYTNRPSLPKTCPSLRSDCALHAMTGDRRRRGMQNMAHTAFRRVMRSRAFWTC